MPSLKIIWSPAALLHFSHWIQHIARDSPTVAERERKKIINKTARLKSFPRSGRVIPEFGNPGLREIILKPIRIPYRIVGNQIRILTFHHSKKELDIILFE